MDSEQQPPQQQVPEQHDPDRLQDPLEDLEPDADPDSPGLDDDFAEAAQEQDGDPAPSG